MPSRLITRPTSCAPVTFTSFTMPVCVSTSTSATCVAHIGRRDLAAEFAILMLAWRFVIVGGHNQLGLIGEVQRADQLADFNELLAACLFDNAARAQIERFGGLREFCRGSGKNLVFRLAGRAECRVARDEGRARGVHP